MFSLHTFAFLALSVLLFAGQRSASAGPASTASPGAYQVIFDRPQYTVPAGESFTIHVLISPVPEAGVFSYGVKLSFDAGTARVDGASALAIPAGLSFDGPRANAAVTAIGNAFAAVKGTTEFSAPTRPVYTNAVLASFLVTDLGSRSPYELRLGFFNTLGPSEQIFVDGTGNVLDANLTMGQAVVVRPVMLEAQLLNALTLNRQSGLFEQTVRVFNRGAIQVSAFRLLVRDVPPTWQIWNAQGLTNGIPWLGHNSPVAAGQSVDLRVEYRIPDRNPHVQPAYAVESAVPANDPGPPQGTPFAITPRDRLKDGTFLLEFNSVSNRQYRVQYSRDLEIWTTVQPAVTGNGSRLQWIDYGPPRTDSLPSSETNRYYRVFLLP